MPAFQVCQGLCQGLHDIHYLQCIDCTAQLGVNGKLAEGASGKLAEGASSPTLHVTKMLNSTDPANSP